MTHMFDPKDPWNLDYKSGGYLGVPMCTRTLRRCATDAEQVNCPDCLEAMAEQVEESLVGQPTATIAGQPGASIPPGATLSDPIGQLVQVVEGGTIGPSGEIELAVEAVE